MFKQLLEWFFKHKPNKISKKQQHIANLKRNYMETQVKIDNIWCPEDPPCCRSCWFNSDSEYRILTEKQKRREEMYFALTGKKLS